MFLMTFKELNSRKFANMTFANRTFANGESHIGEDPVPQRIIRSEPLALQWKVKIGPLHSNCRTRSNKKVNTITYYYVIYSMYSL